MDAIAVRHSPRTPRAGSRRALAHLCASDHVDHAIVLFVTGKLVDHERLESGEMSLRRPGPGPRARIRERVLVTHGVGAEPRETLHDVQRLGGSLDIRSGRPVLEI